MRGLFIQRLADLIHAVIEELASAVINRGGTRLVQPFLIGDVANLQAGLEQVEAQIAEQQAQLTQAQAQLQVAQLVADHAANEWNRYKPLVRTGASEMAH